MQAFASMQYQIDSFFVREGHAIQVNFRCNLLFLITEMSLHGVMMRKYFS